MTIRHIVNWKLATEDATERAAQSAEIVRRLEGLVGVVPQIGSLSAGANSLDVDGNWDVAVVADFASREDLDAYQVDPAHQEVVSYVRSVVSQRSCVDYEV